MPASDDENDDGESEEPYEIESPEFLYNSDETIASILADTRRYLNGESSLFKTTRSQKNAALASLADVLSLLKANPDALPDDALEVLELPEGWTSEIDEDDDESE